MKLVSLPALVTNCADISADIIPTALPTFAFSTAHFIILAVLPYQDELHQLLIHLIDNHP
jgi:hypothetical protein